MNVPRQLINELWKIRLPVLNMRKPGWIKESFLLPLVLLILPLFLNQQIILWLGLGYSEYLIATIIIFVQVSRIKAGRFRGKYSYQLSSLLYGIYDLASLMLLGAIFWDSGMVGLNHIGMLNELVALLLFVWVIAIVLIAIIFTPSFLAQRIKQNSQPKKSVTYKPLAFALASALPGIGILIGSIVSRTGNFPGGSLFFIAIMLFVCAIFLITFSAMGLTEIIWIGLQKWPDVHKSGSEFIVTWP
jgi:hypothetical protein